MRYKSKYEMETLITLPSVAWYLKIGEAENILSEWDKVMKVSILCKSFSSGGKKKKHH